MYSLLLFGLLAIASATPHSHHTRQDDADVDNPEASNPETPPSSLGELWRPDGGDPFDGADIPETPDSCTDFWRPSEDCVRDLMKQSDSDDAFVSFGGGKLKFDKGGCADWRQKSVRGASWDAYTLASRIYDPNTAPVRQAIWRAYMGPDFNDHASRIKDNFKRAAGFRGDDKFDIIITCKDPRNICRAGREGKRVGGYAWTYHGWFGYTYYYIALCQTFFNLDRLKDKVGLVEGDLSRGDTRYAEEAVYQANSGSFFLHEMMHLDAVGNPHITDEKVSSSSEMTAYGPGLVHKLARGRKVDGGGATKASTNADSYAWLANSLYFYDMTGYFPKPPGYKGASISAENEDAQPPVGLHLGTIGQDVTDEELDDRYASALEGVSGTGPEKTAPSDDDLPKPDCAADGTTFAVEDVEDHLYEMCSEGQGVWDTVIAPPISIGTGRTSDGRTKAIGVSQGWDLGGTDEKIWAGVTFSNDACQGYYTLGDGETSQEKVDHCYARLSAVLHGCQTDTRTEKMGGQLEETCAVYAIAVGKENPFEHKRWYKDEGDLQCKDTGDWSDVDLPGLEDTCTCWFSGYPGLTDMFERTGESCDASEVNLAELVVEP